MARQIAIVEDEPSIADNITYALSTEGFASIWCATPPGIQTARCGGTTYTAPEVVTTMTPLLA